MQHVEELLSDFHGSPSEFDKLEGIQGNVTQQERTYQ